MAASAVGLTNTDWYVETFMLCLWCPSVYNLFNDQHNIEWILIHEYKVILVIIKVIMPSLTFSLMLVMNETHNIA
jgi:hypothetical protein